MSHRKHANVKLLSTSIIRNFRLHGSLEKQVSIVLESLTLGILSEILLAFFIS